MVEYIDQRVVDLSWQVAAKSADITATGHCGDNIISGSNSHISIWQFIADPSDLSQLPIAEVASEGIPSGSCKVHLIGNVAFTALKDGTVLLHELVTEQTNRKYLRPLSETKNLHPGYKCTDMLFCAQTNSVITCGNDGHLASFNIDHPKKTTSKQVSESSLKCMDMISPNEVICGTMNGSLKHFDLRTHECVGTLTNLSLSSLLCLQRNPNVNHLAIGGNDQGLIIMYDLRNEHMATTQISAHGSAVTALKYRPKDPNVLYSSSCDGELFRWNLNAGFSVNQVPRKVENIGCTREPLSITSFDINHLGDMLYATDHGALFYNKLQETNV